MKSLFLMVFTIVLLACGSQTKSDQEEKKEQKESELPYLGHHDTDVEGNILHYHTVPPFAFTNQDGKTVTDEDFKGKVYVADFFFTTCPTICPKMTSQMKRMQQQLIEFKDELRFISHTVSPMIDTVEVLKAYAEKNGLDTQNWDLVTGKKEIIYQQGVEGYLVSAQEDVMAPGGFLHSSMFVLVDKEGHIRGMYDGVETEEVDRLIADIKLLLSNE